MPTKNKEKESTFKMDNPLEVLPVKQLKVLMSWKAPLRVFKRRDRDFWTTVGSIVFLVSLILFFIGEWLLIAAVIALVFVYYVFSSIPPEEVEHQITSQGIRFAGKDFPWEELAQFWFSKRWNQDVLNLAIKNRLPGKIELLLGDEEEKKVKEIIGKYLPEETPEPTFLDKASAWLSEKVPLEIGK